MNNITLLTGRLLMSLLFLGAGINKIQNYSATAGWMDSLGVPGMLLGPVIALEILGAIALIIGLKVKWTSLALAAFTIATAFMFHLDFSDQTQTTMFMKNLAIAGGFLVIAAAGAGAFSLDHKLSRRSHS